MSRVASSVSLTITVAVATLVAMTAILAGPTLIECSRTYSGIAACFRERVIESGILPGDDAPSVPVQISAEPSSSPEPSSTVASVEPPPPGWLDAAAAEPLTMSPAPVALAPEPGEIAAVPAAVPEPEPIKVALAQEPGRIENVPATPPALAPAATEISAPTIAGRIDLTMTTPTPLVFSSELSAPSGRIALSPPPARGQGAMSDTSLAPDPMPTGSIVAEARLGTGGQGTGWTVLTFEPEPAEPQGTIAPPPPDILPAPPIPVISLEPEPVIPPVEPIVPVVAPKRPAPPPAPAPPARILKNDPRYPSVTILPPPNTGAASSFITLTLSP